MCNGDVVETVFGDGLFNDDDDLRFSIRRSPEEYERPGLPIVERR